MDSANLYNSTVLLALTCIFTTFGILNLIHLFWLVRYEFWVKGRRPNKFNILLLTGVLLQIGSFVIYSVVGRAAYYQGGVAYDILLAENDGSLSTINSRESLLGKLDNGVEVTKITVYTVFVFLRSYGFFTMKPALHLKIFKIVIILALVCYLTCLVGMFLDRSVIELFYPAASGLGLLVVIMDCYLSFQFIDFIRNSSTWKFQNIHQKPQPSFFKSQVSLKQANLSAAPPLPKQATSMSLTVPDDKQRKQPPAKPPVNPRINSELSRFMIVAKYGAVGTICSFSSFVIYVLSAFVFVNVPIIRKCIYLAMHILHWITLLSLTMMKFRLDQIADSIQMPKKMDDKNSIHNSHNSHNSHSIHERVSSQLRMSLPSMPADQSTKNSEFRNL